MAWRVARSQGVLTLLIVVLLGWLSLHDYALQGYPSLPYSFRESFGFGQQEERLKSPPNVKDVNNSVLEKEKGPQLPKSQQVELDLPEFCDYCGPQDELCQKYGESNLARALAFEGANARLKRVIRKAQRGSKIKIGILGGSVTAGHGVKVPDRWPSLYENWWRKTFPKAEVEVVNGAVPASETSYYMTCFGEHIDKDVDVIVVEMGINDRRFESLAKSYEFLLRALLELPNKPAVINLHILALSFETITMGGDLHAGIAMYYDSPIISLRNLLLPHLFGHPTSPGPLEKHQDQPSFELESYWFTMLNRDTVDFRHVNVNGHKTSADLLEVFSRRTLCSVLREDKREELGLVEGGAVGSKWAQTDKKLPGNEVLLDVPRMRIFDKYDSYTIPPPADPICMSTTSTKNPLRPISSQTHGWTRWAPEQRPDKIYIRATEPGSRVAFNVKVGLGGTVRVTVLKSKKFGMGSVWCWVGPKLKEGMTKEGGDKGKDKGVRWDGWWNVDNINVGSTEEIKGVAPGEHVLRCELLKETKDPGGGHDFRILAVHAL